MQAERPPRRAAAIASSQTLGRGRRHAEEVGEPPPAACLDERNVEVSSAVKSQGGARPAACAIDANIHHVGLRVEAQAPPGSLQRGDGARLELLQITRASRRLSPVADGSDLPPRPGGQPGTRHAVLPCRKSVLNALYGRDHSVTLRLG